MIPSSLTSQVTKFLENGDRSFLETLLSMDRDDIRGQAVVRYLLNRQHWPFTPESDFAQALEHLFGEYPERKKLIPAEYVKTTANLIKEAFDYECVVIVPTPRPAAEAKASPPRKSRKSPTVPNEDEGVSGSRVFKSINEIDTQGASDRLKKVIEIQRSS